MAKVIGAELLAFVGQNSKTMSEDDLAIQTGYFTKKKDGRTIAHRSQMMRALLSAQGLDLPATKPAIGGGKQLGYRLLVGGRGLVSITGAYSRQIGAEPGDYITLAKVDAEDVVRVSGPCWILRKEEAGAEEPESMLEPSGPAETEELEEELPTIDPARLALVS